MPTSHQCPCCNYALEIAIQPTRKGELHMATCFNAQCELYQYTLTIEAYPRIEWERYIKNAETLARVRALVQFHV